MSRGRTGRERRGGDGDRLGAGDSWARPPCWAGATDRLSASVGPRRSSPAIAAPSASPAPGLSQLQRQGLTAVSPFSLRPPPRSLLVSFLSHFWGQGGWRLRKCTQGRRPDHSGWVSRAPHAHPARGWQGCREHRGVRDLRSSEGLSRPRTLAAQPSDPAFSLTGFKSPGRGMEGKPLSPPHSSPPTLPFEVVFSFQPDNQTFGSFIHRPETLFHVTYVFTKSFM